MSVWSYYNYQADFPKDTAIYESRRTPSVTERDGMLHVEDDGEGRFSNRVLDELIELLGRPLDEVPGLHLEMSFEWDEDEPWRAHLVIDDGEVTCEQTEMVWRKCDPWQADLDIGLTPERKARVAWDALGDVLVDDDGRLIDTTYIPCIGWRTKGTDREEIWHDIEDMLHVSVAYLMGQAKNPDGTND